jgi:hypothetical protein
MPLHDCHLHALLHCVQSSPVATDTAADDDEIIVI